MSLYWLSRLNHCKTSIRLGAKKAKAEFRGALETAFVFATLLLLMAPQGSAYAQSTYQLFKDGRPHRQYDLIIQNVSPGDKLRFSNGAEFTVTRSYINPADDYRKGSSAIFGVLNHRILRLPKHCSDSHSCRIDQERLLEYVRGHQPLHKSGILMPKIYFTESDAPEYLVQEELVIRKMFSQWLREFDEGRIQPSALAIAAVKKFFVNTAPFTNIGDFHAGQVALTDRGVYLLDWTEQHTVYTPLAGLFDERLTSMRTESNPYTLAGQLMHEYPNLKPFLSAIESIIHSSRHLKIEQLKNLACVEAVSRHHLTKNSASD